MLALVLGLGAALWRHWTAHGSPGSLTGHLPYLAIDAMLAVPMAATAIWLVGRLAHRLGFGSGSAGTDSAWTPLVRAAAVAVVFAALSVPLAIVQALAEVVVGAGNGHAAAPFGDVSQVGTVSQALGYGATQALQAQPAILMLAIVGGMLGNLRPGDWLPGNAGRYRRLVRPAIRPVGRVTGVLILVAGMLTGAFATAGPAVAADTAGATQGNCDTAPTRTFNVVAIDVDITVDRFGDHDPFGYMYVLADHEDEVRAQEAALHAASSLPVDDASAAKVSVGLGNDAIQPLVLRAHLGECVVINLQNKLQNAPRSGNGVQTITQPGGVPSVSLDMEGVAYDAAGGKGGQAVGNNPDSVMAPPGQSRQYRYYLDPLMGEGAKVFHSGGDAFQLTGHGLFGTLVAEKADAKWFDTTTGQDKTNDTNWSNWAAMIQPLDSPTFREFTIIYHEVGDENFNLRRPLRENANGTVTGDQAQFGRNLPMIDTGALNPLTPTEGGGGTNSYRPGSRALNYRSEPFFRRLQLLSPRGLTAVQSDEGLGYSSYSFGDPATPMPRSYLGEPTITRLVHAGMEQLHVHHLHGGGDRWRQNPDNDDPAIDGGLVKVPGQNPSSIRLDSQTISPGESYNLEHECGAGGCQQAAGDFLYHCHIAHHYIAGMWGIWRVYNTHQADLAALPGKSAPADGVTSAALLGKKLSDGRTVVLGANLTNPNTQVGLESLIEGQLPPQGERFNTGAGPDPDDATVWDWQKSGPATAPVYLSEPETTSVWADYRSATPGQRRQILFNPVDGRAAYPMLTPHLGLRPPFSPNGHSGAPYLGDNVTAGHPDGLCPQGAPLKTYDITAITTPIQNTERETDPDGEIFVLNEDKAAVKAGTKPADPLTIRSNVGDCVAITLSSELNPAVQQKVNMHTHFVQFDPRASDGVITGFAYEQSVFSDAKENRTLTSVVSSTTIQVSNVNELRPGISIGVGVGRPSVEVKKITAINGNQLTFDSALAKTHAAGEPVTVEFVQYRWYSDVDSGTVFWHDHVNGIQSWAHGLFGAHIIEPKGSTYRDPVTGNAARSGTIVDIVNSNGSVGVGQSGSFREFMIFLHNGRRGRNELNAPSGGGLNGFNWGQECEEGSINLRAAPVGERTAPGATPADPATTDQRQEYNGERCRNAFSRTGDNPTNANANTVPATVSTVDPYVFSSVKYGDPRTPLLRAYAGDPVVIRTVGLAERAEALRVQGHRFRMERFAANGQLMDAATTGISERFDYVLDGGAGGPSHSPGDYLYYSTRQFAFESGAWGIFRVHNTLQSNLKPLPDRAAPPSGAGFPKLTAATGNTQQSPGPNPPSAYNSDGTVNTSVVTNTANPCPTGARTTAYNVSVINQNLPTAPQPDTGGVIYALTTDVPAIRAGTKPVEPLVLRANQGDCVKLTLHNDTTAGSLFGGGRAGLDLAKLTHNQQLSAGSAVGLNPDTTVQRGSTITYTYYADASTGTSLFTNPGSVASMRHGAYGELIVEPNGSSWFDSVSNAPLSSTITSSQAIIRGSQTFREFAVTMGTSDQQYARSIIPYIEMVAGNGLNSPVGANIPAAPVPGAPPGTANNPGSRDKGFNNLNYHSEPLTSRLGLTANPADFEQAEVIGGYGLAFSSHQFGDPDTPVFKAFASDPVVFRVGVGSSDQFHVFGVSGHAFPLEPNIDGPDGRHSQVIEARTLTAGETVDAWLVGGAGGPPGYHGDYLFGDGRQPFQEAGMWGIFRVQAPGSSGIAPL